MPYTSPTPADLKERFPRFAAVGDAVLQGALDEAARWVDESWPEGDFAMGRMLYAAHVLTQDGVGEGTEAQLNAEGVGDFQTIKLGSLSLSRFGKEAQTGPRDDIRNQFQTTTYGQRFWVLASRVGSGPVSTGDATAIPISPNARDVPMLPGLTNRWTGNG